MHRGQREILLQIKQHKPMEYGFVFRGLCCAKLRQKVRCSTNKKVLVLIISTRTDKISVLPPCFTMTSRSLPPGVPTYSCALTGAPVTDYLSPAQLRDHLQHLYPCPITPNRDSLDGILMPTLLFTACSSEVEAIVTDGLGFVNTFLLILQKMFSLQEILFSSRKHFVHHASLAPWYSSISSTFCPRSVSAMLPRMG